MVDKSWTIQQRAPPWWSWSPVQRHGFLHFQPPPPGSLWGRGWPRVAWLGFTKWYKPAEKKIVAKLNDFIIVYTSYSTYNAPKMIVLRFPHASRLSHLPSILPSVAAACFWLVVVWAVVEWWLSKALVYFMFIYFLTLNSTSQTMELCLPMRSPSHAPSLLHPHYFIHRF